MSPQRRVIGFNAPRQQHGAIGLMAAVTLGMVLLFMLLVVDSGRLYLEQRKLQRVADMAVLEAVTLGGSCGATPPSAQSLAETNAKLNNFIPGGVQQLAVTCGTLKTDSATQVREFTASSSQSDAIRVIATTTVPTSVAGGLWSLFNGKFETKTNLTASAVGASPGPTLAQLSIRSTLASVKSEQSPLLNLLFSGLLGSDVQLSLLGWDGLVKADINLLQYLNELSVVTLDLKVGDYTKLLNTNATVTQLIQAAANVAKVNNSTLEVQTALQNLANAAITVPSIKKISISDLFKLTTGSTTAGLDANVQLFQLVQAFIQVANKNNAIAATLPVNLLGLANIKTQISVIEAPQFSAIGDPALALNKKSTDAQAIYVRTAQIRTLISIEIPLLNKLNGLTAAVKSLLSPITDLLQGVLCILGICSTPSIDIITSPVIHVSLDVGGANALMTNYSCASSNKSLTVAAESSIAVLRVGQIADPSTVFSTKDVVMNPLPLVDISTTKCTLLSCKTTHFGGGGIALTVDAPIVQTDHKDLVFSGVHTPTNLKEPPAELPMKSTEDIVASLKKTLAGVSIKLYGPADSNSVLSTVATHVTDAVTTALNAVLKLLLPLAVSLLGSILDPLVNNILSLLGVNLMDTVIGANLSCNQGGRAQLVM